MRSQRRPLRPALDPDLLRQSDPDCELERDSKVQAEQVRSVSVERVRRALGSVPAPLMLRVDEALRLHLSL